MARIEETLSVTGVPWDLPPETSLVEDALTSWYCARVTDVVGNDVVRDLVHAALQAVREDPNVLLKQSDICAASGRSSTSIQRYFESMESLELFARALDVEISFTRDALISNQFRTGSDFKAGIGPEAHPVSEPGRAANRLKRARHLAMLSVAPGNASIVEGVTTRISLRVARQIRKFQSRREAYVSFDAQTASMWLLALGTARAPHDAGLMPAHVTDRHVSDIWSALQVAVAFGTPTTSAPREERTSARPELTRLLATADLGLSPRATATLSDLISEASQILNTGHIGANDTNIVKEMRGSRPSIHSYLGSGPEFLKTVGIGNMLIRLAQLIDDLEHIDTSTGNTPLEIARLAGTTRQSTPAELLAIIGDDDNELLSALQRYAQDLEAKAAERIADLSQVDESVAWAITAVMLGWGFVDLLRDRTGDQIPPITWNQVALSGWVNTMSSVPVAAPTRA